MTDSSQTHPKPQPGRSRIYSSAYRERGRADVVLWDVLPITNGAAIRVIFETVSSPWRQGVWLKTDKGMIVKGHDYLTADLWADKEPEIVQIVCHTSDGCLSVYNIWDSRRGYRRESQSYSSGMLVEEIPGGRRYRCNDIGFDSQFNKLVFRIELEAAGR